jgi:signal transduction histidine kinase
VSLAAHQLRTPISAIGWYAEMMLSGDAGELTSEQKKYLNQIYNANKRMIDMVKSFLNVSRIEMNSMIFATEETNLANLLDDVIAEQKQKIIDNKIELTVNCDKDMPKLFIDLRKVRMVFQNLLSNAIKYTPTNGKITIQTKTEPDKKQVLISFSDTGYGIPADEKDKIFTKLFRAKNVLEMSTDGTGLGLYVAKNILDNSGGKIWFESEENKGTTFFLTLPL